MGPAPVDSSLVRVRLALGAGLVLVAVLAIGLAWRGLSGGGAAGTLVVSVAARVPDHLSRAGLEVHAATGGWRRLGVVSGTVPAAPRFLTVYQGPAPAGAYDALRLGGDAESIDFRVVAGQVEPLLLAVSGGHLATAGVYAGNQAFSLGLNELSGQFLALPTFRLVDQDGHPFDNARIAGHELVLAPFLTACREACPIYAGLFLELRRELPSSVILAEVTVDPWDDTPAALRAYAQRVGVSWTLATGDPGALVDFWGRLGLQPTRGEMATGLLLVVDDHGFVRAREEGIPHLAASLPPSLADQLDAQGRQLLASGGDGWGAPQVVDAIQAIQRMATVSSPSEGEAPTFSLPARGGHPGSAGLPRSPAGDQLLGLVVRPLPPGAPPPPARLRATSRGTVPLGRRAGWGRRRQPLSGRPRGATAGCLRQRAGGGCLRHRRPSHHSLRLAGRHHRRTLCRPAERRLA